MRQGGQGREILRNTRRLRFEAFRFHGKRIQIMVPNVRKKKSGHARVGKCAKLVLLPDPSYIT